MSLPNFFLMCLYYQSLMFSCNGIFSHFFGSSMANQLSCSFTVQFFFSFSSFQYLATTFCYKASQAGTHIFFVHFRLREYALTQLNQNKIGK